jgi:hypothetical protein
MTEIAEPTIGEPTIGEPPKEKLNIVDSASLTFFTNPMYYSILERKKKCNIKDNSAEIKFYRKRIVSLFKDILKGEEHTSNEIKEIHKLFVNASIRYFEITDKKDIVQGQHTESAHTESAHTESAHTELESANTELDLDILDEIVGPDTVDEANDLMMRKTIHVASLDNYVITKQDLSTNDTRIIPLKMEIDLKTNDLKIKGVPPKKEKLKKL